jgi:membrane associated rhomboid family serine protease
LGATLWRPAVPGLLPRLRPGGRGAFLLLGPANAPAVGASGAIFGLWGAVARLAGAWADQAGAAVLARGRPAGGSAIVSNLLVVGLGAPPTAGVGDGIIGIAWQAHLGGFVAGMLLIQVMPVRFHWLRGPPKPAR